MKYYESRYTGAEVDALLGKVESGEVGGKVTVDSALSTESENPVMNRVITSELGNKANKEDVVQPDWDATRGKAAVKNRPFGFNNPIRLSDADEITRELINAEYDKYRITYKFSGYTFEYGLFMFARLWEYDPTWSFKNVSYKRIYSGDDFVVGCSDDSGDMLNIEVVYDDYTDESYETIITLQGENLYEHTQAFFEENVILADSMEGLRSSLPDIFIPDSIARQESVLDLYEEASLLWDETNSLWDETVYLNGEVSDVKEKVEELESGGGFDTKGIYPDLIAGDLAGRGESVPAEFSFRASGGKSIKDGKAYIKRIKGNSVVWNQLVKSFEYAEEKPYQTEVIYGENNSVTIPNWGAYNPYRFDIKASRVNGHKFLALFDYENTDSTQYLYVEFGGEDSTNVEVGHVSFFKTLNINFDNLYRDFFTLYLGDSRGTTITISNLRLIDLTQMFGAGNEPTTIEEYEARKPIVEDEYAYNEGQVIHCNTESIKSVGDNAWDEQWRQGFYVSGQYIDSPTQICSKNPIQVLPNEAYCINQGHYYVWYYDKEMQFIGYNVKFNSDTFVTPSNAAYIHFNLEPPYGVTYKNDIIVTLVHSGWKQDTDAGYQPYWADTLPLPIISKYFPQGMKKAGSAHDEIRFNKASGKWEKVQRVTSLDLGTLAWGSVESGHFYVQDVLGDIGYGNLICAKYSTIVGSFSDMLADKAIGNNPESPYNNAIFVRDDAYTDAESFKAAMQGVILYYELAEPIVTELDEADQNFRDYYNVADFGTEMSQSNVPSAPFSADIIYQFNAVDMIREHELEINELQQMIATMQAQLVSLTSNNA